MLNSRTLAAAFWLNFFALYWLYLLGVMELDMKWAVAWLFFFAGAMVLSATNLVGAPQKRGGGNGRVS